MLDHSRHVLCRIIPPLLEDVREQEIERDLAVREMEVLLGVVTAETFPIPYRFLFEVVERWFLTNGGVIPDRDIFTELLEQGKCDREADPAELLAIYTDLAGHTSPDDKFDFCLAELKALRATQQVNDILYKAQEINLRGAEVDGEKRKGAGDALDYVLAHCTVVERPKEENLELDARDPRDLLEAYYRAEQGDTERGYIPTGYRYYDGVMRGGKLGEVWVFLAWKGNGKSMKMINLSVNAATGQGKNAIYFTAEMAAADIKRRMYACHSCNPKFGRPGVGIKTRDIEMGMLRGEDRELFLDGVVPDIETNPDYGKLHVSTLPAGSSVDTIWSRLKRYQSQFPLDVVFIDYVQLLQSQRRRGTDREEIDLTMRSLKQLALNFADGEGLWVVTASQTTKPEYQKALEKGFYDPGGFRGSGEIAFSADVTAFLLQTPENKQDHELTAGVMTNRRGVAAEPVRLFENFQSSFIGELAA